MEENVNEPGVRFEVDGAVGIVTLDRPRALNALTHDMVRAIAANLDEWEHDADVLRVLIEGAGDRAFCAGGDVVELRRDALAGGSAALDFWRDEYTLNARIARYPKPVVSIMDGLALGGGVGLAGHSSHRVVTERASVGMPETTIGFVPDVGGTWLLSRLPGEVGTWLALTSTAVGPADAITAGLADWFVPQRRIPELRAALATAGPDETIASVSAIPPRTALDKDREWIDSAFAYDDVAEIVDALRAADRTEPLEALLQRSPTSLVLTLESLRRSKRLPDVESALQQEYRVAARVLRTPDFAEGIRAQLVDKDRAPQWDPPTIGAVDRAQVESFFEPLPEGDLELPPPPAAF
ncbi:enoyl-CoA hydratase/isomerase family protein [Salinibacterium soli]|uniref:3-hydroxyisobutyryl-CoA hydrolase n=1 Tax=Antiquaquibacter soli TaxID=3064523 RepID=A0ABT9BRQ8_9MICO|nr:enoyl-CoA hydratase/isomerase family protein [Protaetiibacter sp. WY-16]MDO7883329.1 enoyl-CoA hydratase/isomerase family protein [Protaetiibacter sp. WY-16]